MSQAHQNALHPFAIQNQTLHFETQPGVFAQYDLDYGSQLLLNTILPDLPSPTSSTNVLDLGCGCGILGLTIAKLLPKAHVWLIDSDIRATRLTTKNSQYNRLTNVEIKISDVAHDLPPHLTFDLIVSNPPTHQGREVLLQFIDDTHQRLNQHGTAYFVVNRLTSMLNKLEQKFTHVEKLAKKNGYIILKAHNQKSSHLTITT